MIHLLNPKLDYNFQDYFGEYLPFAYEALRPLLDAGCYVPRWYQAPANSLVDMAAGDYNAVSLTLPPGSFILAILHSDQESVTGTFTVQITDTALQHQWFSQPVPDSMFDRFSGQNGYPLPKPYPVVSPGVLLIERWCTVAGSCEILFAVAEPEGVRNV